MASTDAFALVRDVPGWLTADQAETLAAAVRERGPGACVVEIGSHHGRSTIVLAAAGGDVVAVDPFPPDWRYGGPDTERQLRGNLARTGVADRVEVRVASSREVRSAWSRPVDVVYIDGKHDYWTVRDDLDWTSHLGPGGVILVHDAFSSLGVTSALLCELWLGRRLRYVTRTGSLALLVPGAPRPVDRLRVAAQLPWWCRNLCVKVLLRLRLAPVARLVGHEGTADPY